MSTPAQALERRDNVVFLHRETWNYFDEKAPEIEGWYVVSGTSEDGPWMGVFELVQGSLSGEVEMQDPYPISYLRLPDPPLV